MVTCLIISSLSPSSCCSLSRHGHPNTGGNNYTAVTRKEKYARSCPSLMVRPLLANDDQKDDETILGNRNCRLNVEVISNKTVNQQQKDTIFSGSSARSLSSRSSRLPYGTPSAQSGGGTYATTTGAATALWKTDTIMNDNQRV